MFSAEMPNLLLCNMWFSLWKQTDGSDSKAGVTLGGNQSTGTYEKGERHHKIPAPFPPLPSLPSSSYQRSHWENWMWFVCVFLKRGAHKQPWKGPLYSARQQRCASLGRPFVFPCSQNLKHRKKRGWFSRCEQAQMMPLDWVPALSKKKKGFSSVWSDLKDAGESCLQILFGNNTGGEWGGKMPS